MHKAQKHIRQIMPSVDVVIEVLDARLPFSSANPMIETLRGNKPFLKVISKSDLADQGITELWLTELKQHKNTQALAISTDKPALARQIPNTIRQLAGERKNKARAIKALIMGIPNVGKSTLINLLAGKKIAAVGNEPAITKDQQTIRISEDIQLIDSPGMTWPGSKNETVNYRLALSGAIRDTALSYDDVGLFAAEFMAERYPERILNTYQLNELEKEAWQILEQIAGKRHCLKKGTADFLRVGELLVRDIRAGKLGALSFEKPGADTELEKMS